MNKEKKQPHHKTQFEQEYPRINHDIDVIDLILTDLENYIFKLMMQVQTAMSPNLIYKQRLIRAFKKYRNQQAEQTNKKRDIVIRRIQQDQDSGLYKPTKTQVKRMRNALKDTPMMPESYKTVQKAVEGLHSWGLLATRDPKSRRGTVYVINPNFYVRHKEALEQNTRREVSAL